MFNYKLDHLRKMFSHRFSAFWLRSSEERRSQSPHPGNPWTFSVFWLQRSHQPCSLLLHPIHVPSWRCFTRQLSINMKNGTALPAPAWASVPHRRSQKSHCLVSGASCQNSPPQGRTRPRGPPLPASAPGAASTDRRCCGGVLFSVRSAPCALRGPLGPLLHRLRLRSCATRKCLSDLREHSRAREGWCDAVLHV